MSPWGEVLFVRSQSKINSPYENKEVINLPSSSCFRVSSVRSTQTCNYSSIHHTIDQYTVAWVKFMVRQRCGVMYRTGIGASSSGLEVAGNSRFTTLLIRPRSFNTYCRIIYLVWTIYREKISYFVNYYTYYICFKIAVRTLSHVNTTVLHINIIYIFALYVDGLSDRSVLNISFLGYMRIYI